MPFCKRTGELRVVSREVASPLLAALGPSPLTFPLLLSCGCLVAMCFSESVREGRNRAFQLLRNYHSLDSSLAASDASLCSRGASRGEGCDRTCASLGHVGFLQVIGLPPCCRGGGGGKGSAAQASRDLRVF